MTAATAVAEIEAMGAVALGIKVDVTDHTAVAGMIAALLRDGVPSISWSPMPTVVAAVRWIPKPARSTRRCSSLWSG